MIEQDKKDKEYLFLSVYHDEISLKQLKERFEVALEKDKIEIEPCILHVSAILERCFMDY
jgi:tRNA(Phe) wybutosine-synthesizing methylase Tyw3